MLKARPQPATRPQPGERWVHKRNGRAVLVLAVRRSFDEDGLHGEVDFKYVPGVGRSGLWRRGVTPLQTFTLDDWHRFFHEGTP